VRDRGSDASHPVKRHRPIAAGEFAPAAALILAAVLLASAAVVAAGVGRDSLVLLAAFVALQAAYTLSLKQVVILDVLAIAGLFVVRAAAGALAVDVPISLWLLLCTALLASFLALGKRRAEYVIAAGVAAVAVVTAVLLTPRIVNGLPPAVNAPVPIPPRIPRGAPVPSSDSGPSEAATKWNPFLLIVRGLGWGAVGGGALGVLVALPTVALFGLAATTASRDVGQLVTFLAIAGLVAMEWGAVVGAALGLAAGLALAHSGRRVVQRMRRARLITASVAAAIPLVKAHFFSQAWGLHLGHAQAEALAVLGAYAAVLLTPLVVHGWPSRLHAWSGGGTQRERGEQSGARLG
jgi:hypothetical protein